MTDKEHKAYMVWVDDSDKGYGVVFAASANKARYLAQYTDACEDELYKDVRAKRIPKADDAYTGNTVGDWADDKLAKVLVEEYGWHCYEPKAEECARCSFNCEYRVGAEGSVAYV